MRFFEEIRPQIYLHGAKLRRDKKTGRRLWGLTLIVTLKPELVAACAGQIEQAYIYLLTLDHQADELMLGSIADSMSIEFYALDDDKKPVLRIQGVDFDGLRLTRDAESVEFWFHFEVENSATVHPFVKEYAFTRLWADFKSRAEEIAAEQARVATSSLAGDPEFVDAIDRLAELARQDGATLTLSTAGMEPVVIDKQGAENIRKVADAVRRKRAPK
jgi:hypothetical protein